MDNSEYENLLQQLRKDLVPIGSIFAFPAKNVPDGYLPCEGQELSIQLYPELYELIGHTWGGGKTLFRIPDLQGKFIRGWDREGDIDPERVFGKSQDDALQGHSHEVDTSKTLMTDSSGTHSHKLCSDYGGAVTSVGGLGNTESSDWFLKRWMSYDDWYHDRLEVSGAKRYDFKTRKDQGPYTRGSGSHSHKVVLHGNIIKNPTSSTYGEISKHVSTETRPKNIALIFCIKVK